MPEEEKTLGRILFGQEVLADPRYAYLRPIEEANSLEEIKTRLFLLKLDTPLETAAYVLERVFTGLSGTLDSRDLRTWAEGHLFGGKQWFEEKFSSFMKQCRNVIGSLALEVFFEAIFEKDRETLWSYLSSADDKLFSASGRDYIEPSTLAIYLRYFSICSENIGRIRGAQIKRFLRHVLDKPLIMTKCNGQKFSVGISMWSEETRRELATALVVNGLYEECLDYNIPEALEPMTIKFCDGQKELPDGFVHLSKINTTLNAAQAMRKACEDKEWGHMWSVITRLAFKHGKAEFLYYWPQMQNASSAQQAKLALVWQDPVLRYCADPKFIGF